MWFSLESTDAECIISFQLSPHPEWAHEVINEHPLPACELMDREVTLQGKAPMWMYACASIVAVRAGARAIRVYQPQGQTPVLVHPIAGLPCPDPGWLQLLDDEGGGSIVEFNAPPAGARWLPEMLPHLAGTKDQWNPELVTLTGCGANWMYAAAAALAALNSKRKIAYFAPKDGHGVLLTAQAGQPVVIPASPSLLRQEGDGGRIIGVVGDPNSGKSVLSILLTHAFKEAGMKLIWRLDCDHAAPTPHWYLQMLEQERDREAARLRDGQKRSWTPEAEQTLARQLCVCAQSLRWVIADFPGGIHKNGPVRRIPEGREALLAAAHHFVILKRADRPDAEEGWRAELAAHDLENRIIAVVASAAPNEPLSLHMDDPAELRATATGLNRTHLSSSHLTSSMPQWVPMAQAIAARVSS